MSDVTVVERFIDCINRGDVDGLAALMADGHQLKVFDEPAQAGRELIEGWRGYAAAYPNYRIYAHRVAETPGVVAVVGHTTGSHLGLPDDEESKLTVIWLGEVVNGLVRSWTLIEDTPANRSQYGLDEA